MVGLSVRRIVSLFEGKSKVLAMNTHRFVMSVESWSVVEYPNELREIDFELIMRSESNSLDARQVHLK